MFRRTFYNPYNISSTWREMDRLQREVNRLFSDALSTGSRFTTSTFPAMNVWTNEDGVVITAELPGMHPDDIDISVSGDTLTLSGQRTPDDLPEGGKYHRRERSRGRFTRTMQLPFSVEANNVEALFEKGILHLSLPRLEAEKPKKITIKAG